LAKLRELMARRDELLLRNIVLWVVKLKEMGGYREKEISG
jgi:hypothetical protein